MLPKSEGRPHSVPVVSNPYSRRIDTGIQGVNQILFLGDVARFKLTNNFAVYQDLHNVASGMFAASLLSAPKRTPENFSPAVGLTKHLAALRAVDKKKGVKVLLYEGTLVKQWCPGGLWSGFRPKQLFQ